MSCNENFNITGEWPYADNWAVKNSLCAKPFGAMELLKCNVVCSIFVSVHLLSAATGLKYGAESITHCCEQTPHGN